MLRWKFLERAVRGHTSFEIHNLATSKIQALDSMEKDLLKVQLKVLRKNETGSFLLKG